MLSAGRVYALCAPDLKSRPSGYDPFCKLPHKDFLESLYQIFNFFAFLRCMVKIMHSTLGCMRTMSKPTTLTDKQDARTVLPPRQF